MPARKIILSFLFIVAGFFFIHSRVLAQEIIPSDVKGIIVKFKNSVSDSERFNIHKRFKAQLRAKIAHLDTDIISANSRDIQQLIENYRTDPQVEYTEPDYQATVFDLTSDPFLANQWGLYKINVAGSGTSGWNITHGNPTVHVAVLDTGIDLEHPDLSSKVDSNVNFSDSPTVDDRFGHGTHVGGIIAAGTNNDAGVAGVGYDVRLENVKVLGDGGSGSYSWIAQGITWAADHRDKVINMSLGAPYASKMLEDAINYAWSKGSIIVTAAGNSNSNAPSYPAYYINAIAVAATDQNDNKASFSNYGSWVDVAAPGVSTYSTLPTSSHSLGNSLSYGYASGTSMASPHVAGLAALLFSAGNISNIQVRELIEKNSDRITGSGSLWIYGRINVYKSLAAETGTLSLPTTTPTPLPSATPTPTPRPTAPTQTPVPSSTNSPQTPTPTPKFNKARNPFSKFCERFNYFCNFGAFFRTNTPE
ncbi:peptidase S8 [Candidatus Woesebacteria bacterium]|nr:peptidase S8 [Candidatus Woesebacteria bacterium]